MKPIYLDHNASTPLADEVIEAMLPYLKEGFGNPSSGHFYGLHSKKLIETARKNVGILLNASTDEIIFTSGGSESNNLSILGIVESKPGSHIITSQIEHPAVLNVCKHLEEKGHEVTYLPVDNTGLVNPDDVENAIRKNTVLITIMLANNEVGTIQPIKEISKIAKKHDIILHTDAAQAVGKILVDVQDLGVDLLSIAGHKMNAPKGIGALYIKSGVSVKPQIFGADHEHGLRPGTENVLEIIGLGTAAKLFHETSDKFIENQTRLRNKFYNKLTHELPSIKLNGHEKLRLPNTLNIYFPGIDSNTLLSRVTDIAASAGAACHTNDINPSHVLTAMGCSIERSLGSIRFSIGRTTKSDEIEIAVEKISKAVKEISGITPIKSESLDLDEIKLTQYTHGLGCACKIRPHSLEKILKNIRVPLSENSLVGFNESDDAAVFKIDDDKAIISTVDFFTPIVDDAYDFGRIAAANSLSDIYAMGGKPLFALNIAAFPEKRLPIEVLEKIIKGAQQTAKEAGISILGGHTVEDNEPKFGFAVTGIAHPEKILRNNGAKPGDHLILTKPIGLGIMTTALKRGLLNQDQRKMITEIMAELNKTAAEVIAEYPVNACTDVTGFGLAGHLFEMVKSSNVTVEINFSKIPLISGVKELIQQGIVPGGSKANFEHFGEHVEWNNISNNMQLLFCDSQTSGGLLISVKKEISEEIVEKLQNKGLIYSTEIGSVIKDGKSIIIIK